jgi:putative copper export protein
MSSSGTNGRGKRLVETLANIAVFAVLAWLMLCIAAVGYLYFTRAPKTTDSGVLGVVTFIVVVSAYALAVMANPSPERWRVVAIIGLLLVGLMYFGTGTAKAGETYSVSDFVGAVGAAVFLTVSLLYLRMAKPSQAAAVVASDSANGS